MKSRASLAEAGEFGFLRRVLPSLQQRRGVVIGPGDDCAVVRGAKATLLTTDALVEGVHFQSGWLSPEQIGAKAMLVNLSDVAAMGGRPRYALLSVGVPAAFGSDALARLHRGAERAARAAGVSIVGGNLSAAANLFVSVALVGEVKRPVSRSGAKPGDLIFVTGTLGDAAAAVQLMKTGLERTRAFHRPPGPKLRRGGGPQGRVRRRRGPPQHIFLVHRFVTPTPRIQTGYILAKAGLASAMIDVSDGLVQDLGHLCAASRAGAVVFEDNLPRSPAYDRVIGPDTTLALCGGEDYELLFTVPRARLARFERLHGRLAAPVSFIGEIVDRPRRVRVRDSGGRLRRIEAGGFQHFKPA